MQKSPYLKVTYLETSSLKNLYLQNLYLYLQITLTSGKRFMVMHPVV